MTAFPSLQIPPPSNWQDFEILCCDLWRAIWNDPNTQRNGRQGQPQHGVDIYGRPNQKDFWAGIQCKGKSRYTHKRLTKKEVAEEVEKAKSFRPTLSQLIIATTGEKDVKVEELARKITEEHAKSELFSVHVWGWHDIVSRLADFPALVEKYYPGLIVDIRELKSEIDTLKEMARRGVIHLQPPPDMSYISYLDILGAELLKKIAEEKGIDERTVKETLINVIHKKVKAVETKGVIINYWMGTWSLAANDLDRMVESISEILDHNTGIIGYEKVPLKIAVKTASDTIEVAELITGYKTWYNQCYNQKIDSTFIVFTESVYQELELSDKTMCTEICTEGLRIFYADTDKMFERGKISTFLEKIGYPKSKLYGRVNEVYVPPVEYNDIKKTLQNKRIVFITGTQEYGKTYTAVRLLWEYFNRGYEPTWIKGGEEKERIAVREKLQDIGAVLTPHHIIYFEDPFGKRIYERKEGLERDIGRIIENCDREDTYVIITSREEVFKEFEKEKLSKTDIRKFEKRLNLKKPSYTYRKRKEILEKWAENEGCTWMDDEELKQFVFKDIRDETVLPTPLSMRDFSKATVHTDTKAQLLEKIKEKSEETAMAFSKEIKNMTDDKVLFLLLLAVGQFTTGFVKTVYGTLVKTLEIPHAWEVDRVLYWFKDDKITVSDSVEFSHPSYAEAVPYVLVENGYPTWIMKEIFSPLLLYLSEIDEASEAVAWTIACNFDNLSDTVQKVLIALCEKDNVARVVAWHIVHHFDGLSKEVQNLLFTLIEKDEASEAVAWTIAYNFDSLPHTVQNVLITLAEKDKTGAVAEVVAQHFDKIPGGIRDDLLKTLSKKEGAAKPVAKIVVQHFDALSDTVRTELLLNLARTKSAGIVAEAVVQHFDQIPDTIRNYLLKTLSKKEEAAKSVAEIVVQHFDALSDTVRTDLLKTLSKKEGAAKPVAEVVSQHFDKLPSSVRNDLLKTLSKKETAEHAAKIVVQHFDALSDNLLNNLLTTLPQNVKDTLLKTLAAKNEAAAYVAEVVEQNFFTLPRPVINDLLKTLAAKNEAAKAVAKITAQNFTVFSPNFMNDLLITLPNTIRNDLLKTLSKKEEAAETVAEFLVKNIHDIPHTVRNDLLSTLSKKATQYTAKLVVKNINDIPYTIRNDLLLNLSKKSEAAVHVARAVVQNFDKFPRPVINDLLVALPDNVRNNLLNTLSEKEEAAGIVARFVVKTFDSLPGNVRNNLLSTLSEKEEAAGTIAGSVIKHFDTLPRPVRNRILVNLTEKDGAAGVVAGFVTHNFKRFPRTVRNNLLLNLSEKDGTVRDAVRIIAKNFNRLSSSVRNKRLLDLAEKDSISGDVAEIVAQHFDALPNKVRNTLLVTLSEKDKAAKTVVKVVVQHFDKLSITVQNTLLVTLSRNNEASNLAKKLLSRNYGKFSEELRFFLLKLSRNG